MDKISNRNIRMTKKELQRDILNASYKAGACHIGSSFSCIGILIDLFYKKNIQPENFIFGKASGVAAYYSILADKGFFPKEELSTYLKNYPLPSVEVPGIRHSLHEYS